MLSPLHLANGWHWNNQIASDQYILRRLKLSQWAQPCRKARSWTRRAAHAIPEWVGDRVGHLGRLLGLGVDDRFAPPPAGARPAPSALGESGSNYGVGSRDTWASVEPRRHHESMGEAETATIAPRTSVIWTRMGGWQWRTRKNAGAKMPAKARI
jgi:hypothetical protein